jgi:hypothetical protein
MYHAKMLRCHQDIRYQSVVVASLVESLNLSIRQLRAVHTIVAAINVWVPLSCPKVLSTYCA